MLKLQLNERLPICLGIDCKPSNVFLLSPSRPDIPMCRSMDKSMESSLEATSKCLTTGTFTKEAVNEAKRDGTRPIDLIDGEALCRLMKEKNLGLKVVTKEDVTVEKEFFDQFK